MGSTIDKASSQTWAAIKTWLLYAVRGVFTLFVLIAVFAFWWGAGKEHWLLLVVVILAYAMLFCVGLFDLWRRALKGHQVVFTFALLIMLLICIFAGVSYVLHAAGAATYTGFDPADTWPVMIVVADFYWWVFLDMIPVVDVAKTFYHADAPLKPANTVAGIPLVGFRLAVVLVLLREIKDWWQWWKKQKAATAYTYGDGAGI